MERLGKDILSGLFQDSRYDTNAFSARNVLSEKNASFLCYTEKIMIRSFGFVHKQYHITLLEPEIYLYTVAVYLANILCNYKNNTFYDYIVAMGDNKLYIYEFIKDNEETDRTAARELVPSWKSYTVCAWFFNTKKIQDWQLNQPYTHNLAFTLYYLQDDTKIQRVLKDLRWEDRREMLLVAYRIQNGHYFHILKYIAVFL